MTRLYADQEAAVAHARRAMASHQAGRVNEAETLYRRAPDANPKLFEALYSLGILKAQHGRHEEAIG